MHVLRKPRFIADFYEAYAYLADRSPASAARFLREVESVVELLKTFPEVGRARDELQPGVRSFRVRRFRHLVFYRAETDKVVLLRILHSSRNIQPDMIA